MRIETVHGRRGQCGTEASPGFRAGCGLKLGGITGTAGGTTRITRLSGRVRIETPTAEFPLTSKSRITRLSGRVRIETHQPGLLDLTAFQHHPAFGPGAD